MEIKIKKIKILKKLNFQKKQRGECVPPFLPLFENYTSKDNSLYIFFN